MNEMLNEIVISPDNQNFKFTDEYKINSIPKLECLEDKPKMIVSKSDNQNFDTVIFASRNIEEAAIPSYIKYIHDNAFELCMNLSVFLIPEDSQLKSIGKHAFALTSISSLYFPSDLEELGKGWCESMSDLLFIEISPDNNNFKFADFEEKLIIGKSDKNKEEFDLLVIACRDISEIIIPPSIKCIQSHSISYCNCIDKFTIPEDSKLVQIDKYAFSHSDIDSIFIPKTVEVLEEGWCDSLPYLCDVVLSEDNKNYIFDEQRIILGKSYKKSNVFDVVVFACRNIKKVTIQPWIRYIQKYAFQHCNCLQTVNISEDSELERIQDFAFFGSSIKSIIIPKKEKHIECAAFDDCNELRCFEFLGDVLESRCDLFDSCQNLFLVSFPNVRKIAYLFFLLILHFLLMLDAKFKLIECLFHDYINFLYKIQNKSIFFEFL